MRFFKVRSLLSTMVLFTPTYFLAYNGNRRDYVQYTFKIVYFNSFGECAHVKYAEQYKLICISLRLDHYSAPWYCLLQLISWPTTLIDVITFSKL